MRCSAERLAGSPSSASNYAAVIELSYKAAVLPGWTVQPDLQYVFNPGQNVGGSTSSEAIPNALVLGLADHAVVLILALLVIARSAATKQSRRNAVIGGAGR